MFRALTSDINYISLDLNSNMMHQSPIGWRVSGSGERRQAREWITCPCESFVIIVEYCVCFVWCTTKAHRHLCKFASLFACLFVGCTLLICFYQVNGLQEYNHKNLSFLMMYFMTKHLNRGGLFASLFL